MIVSMNGTLIEQAEAVVSIYDHGFLYGIGLFETFRTYGGRPFLLERHLQRLAEGCEQLAIRPAPTAVEVSEQIARLLAVNGLTDAYFRLTVTAGSDALGLPAGDYERPTAILYVKPLPPSDEAVYRTGRPLQLLSTRRNTPEGLYRFKSLHYMNNLLAKRELQSRLPAAPAPTVFPPEGLMLTADGHLAEGIVSNLFFVRSRGDGGDGAGDSGGSDGLTACLCTPALSTGILPGITRAYVMELASAIDGVRVEEGLYAWDDLTAADEVFMTNSIQEIVPITTLLDERGIGHAVGRGTGAGSWTERLLQLYRKEANLI